VFLNLSRTCHCPRNLSLVPVEGSDRFVWVSREAPAECSGAPLEAVQVLSAGKSRGRRLRGAGALRVPGWVR